MDTDHLEEISDMDLLGYIWKARRQIEQFVIDVPKGTATAENMSDFITLVLAEYHLRREAIKRGMHLVEWMKGEYKDDSKG